MNGFRVIWNTENFIKKANEVHNNKYDYTCTLLTYCYPRLIQTIFPVGLYQNKAYSLSLMVYNRSSNYCKKGQILNS